MGRVVKVRAYCSAANLGPGFDMLAVALNAYYDEVVIEVEDGRGVYVEGVEGPYASGSMLERNTAAEAVKALLEGFGVEALVRLRIYKGIPTGRGLGSSGASAAAAVAGVARLLGLNVDLSKLAYYAGLGERVSAGSPHFDNTSASLAGGLVTLTFDSSGELQVVRVPFKGYFSVVTPMNPVPEGKTGVMRSVLPERVSLSEAVRNFSRPAVMVAAAFNGDLELFGRLMSSDEIVEPRRSKFVPCYGEVRRAAFEAGALGFSLSGAGPSMIALAGSEREARRIAEAMAEACTCCDGPLVAVASPAPGAEVVG